MEIPNLTKAISTVGDPHHIEPTSSEVKKMLNSDVLLSAPMQLHPWSQSVTTMRGQSNKRTLEFETADAFKTVFKNASNEALAHFWLYPKIHCDYWHQFHAWLKIKSKPPKCPYLEIEKQLEQAASAIKLPIIISHDALVPLLRSWGIDAYAIRGAGHHQEPGPAQLKALQKLLVKHEKVIWLVESRIHFPASIKTMQRAQDQKIDIDSSGDYPLIGLTPLQRLQLLFAKI